MGVQWQIWCSLLFLLTLCYQWMWSHAQPNIGVSLELLGQTIPNNSLVNLDDFLYRIAGDPDPTSANGLQTLMCVTDLAACCESQALGNWYYPDGRTIGLSGGSHATFQRNRDQNEVINDQQFYGSVRLWRRYTPPERGLFRCELPDTENIVQTLYVNILFFDRIAGSTSISVAISPSGPTTAGETYSLMCSATLRANRNPPLPDPNIPSPTFGWFFGPNGNDPLPPSLTPTPTVLSSGIYTSTLQFFPLSQSHAGNYTCRLGAGSLENSARLTVDAPPITVTLTANLSSPLMLGQTGNTLTCDVFGADNLNPTITYQWTRNGETVPDVSSGTLNLSPLTLTSSGEYTCNVTVSSTLLESDIQASALTPKRVKIQIGVSLELLGQTIPNNSLVNLDDFLYRIAGDPDPTSANGLQTLVCVTDLAACCESQALGNWYYPDGRTVGLSGGSHATFQRNRDQNEVINDQQFYGSVRLWRRYTPPERGLFRCELPDAENIVQTLYVNILFFDRIAGSTSISVAISPSGPTTAGETYSLMCSATLRANRNPPIPDPSIPSPTFEWFFGPNGNDALPPGLTPTPTVLSSGIYISTLQFFPLSQSHAGNYTCRLGAGSLENSARLTVDAPPITVTVTANLSSPLILGQTGNTLTCDVFGADNLNPTITYQWTRNGETVPDVSSGTLNLSPLTLTSSGEYTCNVTVSSTLLNSDIQASALTPKRVKIQIGVSLELLGQTIPNNSLVNLDDFLYRIAGDPDPTSANGLQTLVCVTDLAACCESQALGNWYYPDGRTIGLSGGSHATFQRNRDQNEVINDQQFYGSVRLWRRYTPPERGLFRCELPDAENIVQTLYVNILFFDRIAGSTSISVAISPSGPTIAGETYSLMCSATLRANRNPPLPNSNIPSPTFEWFFGPNGNDPLPPGLTPTPTILSSGTYISTLQFYPLNQSHAGNYTCRLGAGSLVNSALLTVNAPPITVTVTANLNSPLMLGQTGNTLTCDVFGADNLNPTITYKWTRNGEIVPESNSRTVNLSPLTLSSAGKYTCNVTVSSTLLNSDIPGSTVTPQRVEIQVPDPQSVTVTSSDNFVSIGSSITVICTVELGPAVMESELSLLMVDAQLSKDGTPLTLTDPTLTGTTLNFGAMVSSFSENDVGNYTCTATIRAQHSFTFLTGMGQLQSSPFEITPLSVVINPSAAGTPTAGEIYSLDCSLAVMTDPATYQWFDSNGTQLSNTSLIQFSPLLASHAGLYTCRATVGSVMVEETITVIVIFSTPNVLINVPPGPLFAGSIAPLTLTCTISINTAIDTDVSVTDMDVSWMRGNTSLSNSDSRVTISAVSGSRPLFTSTLTLDPLSTADNTTFNCQARARPPENVQSFITASETGERTTSVVVNLPSPPAVKIDPFNSVALAGVSLRVLCSVIPQEGIMYNNNLAVTWTRDSTPLPHEESSGATLYISSVRTSHGGEYTCTAGLFIPLAGVDIYGANTTSVSIQFVPPPPIISGSPRNASFFQGLDFIFTCSINLGNMVDTPVMVKGIWNRNGSGLMDGNDNGRISINNSVMTASPYQITLRFNPLIISDAGTYECHSTITPQDTTFISTATTSNSRTITIADFPTQFVDVTAEGISTAGFSGYTLICNTSREPDLPPTSTLAVQWLDPRGNVIISGENFTITGAGPTSDDVLISRLVFNNLYTSQAGEYTCRTLETIPGTVVNHPEFITFPVQVKLPAPISPLIFYRSRNSTLNAGTSFALTCVITPNTTAVDTEFRIESNIAGNGLSGTNRVRVSQPVSVGGNTFETTVIFSHLLEADSGAYSCSAYITSPPSQPNVIASDSISCSESINVDPLNAPIVTISPMQILTAGDRHMLTCTATVDEFLIAAPILEWKPPKNAAGVSIGTQSTIRSISTITLTFNNIRTSQAGVYECRTTINITGIEPLSQTANQTVQVQISPPSVLVLDPLALPYNGTVFTVTGMVELDQSVDTDVTASGLWSNNGGVFQETMSPPYLTNLTFRPLATDSSDVYTLTVSVRPSDSSPYVVGNNGSTDYSLVVQPLPSRPPTIAIVSRRELNECEEVMTLNCTANQVENLFSPPTIIWIAPDGREVSTIESNHRRMDPQTGYLIFSDITTNNRGPYTCLAVVNIPEAHIDNYYDKDMVQVNTNLPGMVGNLVCTRSFLPSELSFSWEPPTLLGSEVVNYQVLVSRLEHRPGTRDVVQSSVYEKFVETKAASITGLVAEVPYNVTVKALNLAGCGEENQTYCFTQEGVPPPPENIIIQRFDSTSIGVSWTKFTLIELKGLANYIITYNIIIGSRKRQSQLGGTMTVPWTQNQIIISGLQPGAEYDITVRTSTAAGISAPGYRTSPPQQTAVAPASSNSDNMVAIIGGVIAVVIVLIIAVTTAVTVIVIIIAVILKSRRGEFSPNQKPLPYEAPGSMMLSDLSPTNEERQVYATIEADHEYSTLDKYNQAYEEIKVPPPKPKLAMEAKAVQLQSLSSTDDCEFTQCPAYIPVATISSHYNTSTNKPTDTPSVQSTTA